MTAAAIATTALQDDYHVLIYTRSNMEQTAAEGLMARGFVPYLPQFLRERYHARRRDWVPTPLFPCYLFVLASSILSYRLLRSVNGVANVNGTVEQGPRRVSSHVIDRIRSREVESLDADGKVVRYVQLEPMIEGGQAYHQGERLRLTGYPITSPLEGLLATFMRMTTRDRAMVAMRMFGGPVDVEVEMKHLERAFSHHAEGQA